MKNEKFGFKAILKLLAASVCLGALGGVIGAGFTLGINLVTSVRASNSWLIFLLPVCGVIVSYWYKKFSLEGVGTNNVLRASTSDEKLSPALAFGVFIASVFSHLCGASVGREGAALQIGGSLSAVVGEFFALTKKQSQILIRAGLSALFAAVFGAPLTAFFFALEIVIVGTMHLRSAFFCLVASFAGYFTALSLGINPEKFSLNTVPPFSYSVLGKVALLTALTSLLSIVFCYSLRYTVNIAMKLLKNAYLRAACGGALIVLLSILLKTNDYNGAGVTVIEHIFESEAFRPEAFALKLLFTCISLAAGFKGGEIVPTLFIGSTFGALIASVIGLPIPFGAALGMILLFCGVTNCPLASLFLSIELFSGVGIYYFLPTVFICFLLSGKISLYSAQKHKYKLL